MADCKACGAWFESTTTQDLCPTCKRALIRLGKYVVPVRHSTWALIGADKRGRGGVWVCSACEKCYPVKSDHCPGCGAKMDKKDGDENAETD